MKVLCVLESVSRVDGGIFEAERSLQRELVVSQGCEVNVVALRDEFTDLDSHYDFTRTKEEINPENFKWFVFA
jgi:hypothetical protein